MALERHVATVTEGAVLMNAVHECLLALEDNVGEGDNLGGMLTGTPTIEHKIESTERHIERRVSVEFIM